MVRRLNDVLAALPRHRRERVETRFEELRGEVESLGDLRRAAGKAQAEIAVKLNIKQPSISKIERQTDLYLSTLKGYVEALGGELDLIVRLPSREPLKIERLGDVTPPQAATARRNSRTKRTNVGRPKVVRAG